MSKWSVEPGARYGRLTALRSLGLVPVGANKSGRLRKQKWLFRCECGNECAVEPVKAMMGHTKSCGCLSRERLKQARTKHSASTTPEYQAWQAIIARCGNPRHIAFKYYGARGIKICDEWRNSFAVFIAHIGPRPGREFSIDRIDNNGDYEPGNVRWATRSQQSYNQRPRHSPTKNDLILGLLSEAG